MTKPIRVVVLLSGGGTTLQNLIDRIADGRLSATIVHVLSYAPQRRTPTLDLVEEATPLVGATLSVRLATPPKSVTQQPGGARVEFKYNDGYLTAEWSSTTGHDVLVIE